MPENRRRKLVRCLPFLVLCAGCSIDDRSLSEGEGGRRSQAKGGSDEEGGSSDEGGRASGGTSSRAGSSGGGDDSSGATSGSDGTPRGGSAGSSAERGPCPDLDGNSVEDCDETLLRNASFDRDESIWRTDPDITIEWDPFDATSREGSGSLAVENTAFVEDDDSWSMAGVSQCMRVEAGTKYALYAQAHIQSDRVTGMAGIGAWFYETPDCSGVVTLPLVSPQVGTIDSWNTLTLTADAPATARSMLFRLQAAKPFELQSFSVRFDNALAKAISR